MKNIKLTSIVKQIVKESNKDTDLDEIALMSGDADKATSLDLLGEFAGMDDKFLKILIQLYGEDSVRTYSWDRDKRWYNDPAIRDNPADARIRAYIKSNAIESQGALYILISRSNRGSGTAHHLINLDEPVRTMYVGRIETTPSTGPYSMKAMFGIDSQVVHWSDLAQEYKGYGYGKFLYDTLLYRYKVLESDSTLYQGSQRMWMSHMPKVAKFFGGTVYNKRGWGGGSQAESPTLVIPLTPEDVADRKFVSDKIGSFVAFHSSVPVEIAKIAKLTKGLSYRAGTLGIAYFGDSINADIWDDAEQGPRYDSNGKLQSEDQSFIDWLESEKGDTSFEELAHAMYKIMDLDYSIKFDNAKILIILAEDATVVITRKGASYDYTLL